MLLTILLALTIGQSIFAQDNAFYGLVKKAASEGLLVKKTIVAKAKTSSSFAVEFSNDGYRLDPKEAIYISVPSGYDTRDVNFIILGHRQDPAHDTGKKPEDDWDHSPGNTSVQIYASNSSLSADPWRYWGGDASGSKGAKFAQASYSAEMENLYQWQKLGHRGVKSDQLSKEGIKTFALRLVSVGKDPVFIHSLTIKIKPKQSNEYEVHSFTDDETVFPKYDSGMGGALGGGQSSQYMGTFPGAIVLSDWGGSKNHSKLKDHMDIKDGRLEINLKEGVQLNSLELAIGDSHPDKITNDDGGFGTKGWARLNVGLSKPNGKVDWFIKNENLPPEGFLIGAPSAKNYIVQEGDKIIIEVNDDKAYLMALRIGYDKR